MSNPSRLIPVLRSFDEAKAREFYIDFLGFEEGFAHRFEDNTPLYMGIDGYGVTLHISEHHGDASPGAHVRIQVEDVKALAEALNAKGYKYNRPDVQEMPWGSVESTIPDPFGNRITFTQPL